MTFLELFKQEVNVHKNIPYLVNGGERHVLDIYTPPNPKGLPVTMWFYGGGWRSGDKRLFEHLGRAFAARGIITVAANYRLTPEVGFPDNADDCAAAMAWTYRNIQEYGGDPERFFVTGHSAGAHLAAMVTLDARFLKRLGLSHSIVKGVVMISGATDLAEYVNSSVFTEKGHIEETFGDTIDELRAASPLTWVSSDDPPFLIIIAENDPPGLHEQGRRLVEALRDVDVFTRSLTVKGRDHFTIVRRFGPSDDTTANSAGEFINRLAKKVGTSKER